MCSSTSVDGLTWIFDGANWQQMGAPVPEVFVSATASETPSAPGTTTLPPSPIEGSVFLNSVDSAQWIFDPASTPKWQPFARGAVSAVVAAGSGLTPANQLWVGTRAQYTAQIVGAAGPAANVIYFVLG